LEEQVWDIREELAALPADLAARLREDAADGDQRVLASAKDEIDALASTVLDLNSPTSIRLRRLSVVVVACCCHRSDQP
jgi:hypothetical protein